MLKNIAQFLVVSVLFTLPVQAAETGVYREQKTSTYKDIYDQNVHSEIVNQLDFSRWGRKLFRKALPSANINVFDEVPDSAFFTNRHARTALSEDQLLKGYFENEGPDVGQDLIVVGGEIDGLHLSYQVKDSRGDLYLIKFDSAENLELATAAEVIGSRFYHALGYNVSQYTIATIPAGKLKIGDGAKFRDDTGFLKPLSQERLDEYLLFAPQTDDGSFRVSARKIFTAESKGSFSFTNRRKNDPEDLVNHRDRREIRALSVFAAWLNNTDVSESNTVDVLVTENGKTFLKHYLTGFDSTFGSAQRSAKPPMVGHEYLADFGETTKAFFTLGFWEKPWQKRWREAGEKPNDASAVGYFDNRGFNACHFKVQLPYETFKNVTRADGFWAAKQIMSFKDGDIRAMVSSGKITQAESTDYITKTLIERRDLIVKHWLEKANPLDDFRVESGKLVFTDLAVQLGFAKADGRSYRATLVDQANQTKHSVILDKTEMTIDSAWFQASPAVTFEIQTQENGPFVRVTFNANEVLSIRHQD